MVEPRTQVIETHLPNGTTLHVEAELLGGEEEVGITFPDFNEVIHTLEGISESVMAALKRVKPRKASVEFGLAVALESGQLTALLVKGTGTSNLKVTLEWGDTSE
jgi:hypothetical protein